MKVWYSSVAGRYVSCAFSKTPTYHAIRVTSEVMSMGDLHVIIFYQCATMPMTGEQRIFFAIAYRQMSSEELHSLRSAREKTTIARYLARTLGVGLWMETMLFLLLTGSSEISFHQALRSYSCSF